MKINRIEIENFLSTEKASIDFDSYSNLVRVVGLNEDTSPISSNGAGKSTIIEAILFGLFGKTLRKTTEKSMTNFHTEGKCKVTLVVNDNITITRVKKPPLLRVRVGGENVTEDSIASTQDKLNTILNTSLNVFLASMVFGQQNSLNFLTASAEEKREIIQSFLNLSDLFKYRASIRSLKSRYNADKRLNSTLLDKSLESKKTIEAEIAKVKKVQDEIKECFTKDQLAFIKAHSFADIKAEEDAIGQLERECRTEEMSLHGHQRDVENLKTQLKKNDTCEHCGKLSSDAERTSTLLDEARQNVSSVRSTIRGLQKRIDSCVLPVTSKDFDLVESFNNSDSQLKFLRKKKRQNKKDSITYASEVTEAQKGYDMMRFWEKAFSEQGLVKYVIRNILKFFNERANYYLGVLSKGAFTIEFDDSLGECLNREGTEIYFGSLSGGEKKRVSLAVTLALNDLLILSGKNQSNLIFFDEVADSLDEEGVRGLYDLVSEVTKNKKLFIITHNEYLSSLIEEEADTLEVHKKHNISSFTHK